jgi:hypothetical protein
MVLFLWEHRAALLLLPKLAGCDVGRNEVVRAAATVLCAWLLWRIEADGPRRLEDSFDSRGACVQDLDQKNKILDLARLHDTKVGRCLPDSVK